MDGDRLDKNEIEAAIREADGNLGKAARSLNVNRRTLMRRMRAYGMARGKAGRPRQRLRRGRVGGGAALGTLAALAGVVLVGSKLRKG